MCMSIQGPPYGVPIPPEIHEKFPDDVKAAFTTFHEWLLAAREKSDGQPLSRKDMPENIRQAMELILEAPIPDYPDGVTGKDSCYMVLVMADMVD